MHTRLLLVSKLVQMTYFLSKKELGGTNQLYYVLSVYYNRLLIINPFAINAADADANSIDEYDVLLHVP